VNNRFARLLAPKSIAVFGGQWATSVIQQCKKLGYTGEIWPVHPSRSSIEGMACYKSPEDLPYAPDASFIGVNNESTISVVANLAALGAGGAICMPVLGPNCYGLINCLDRVALWPDQHGAAAVDSGVAIITQSSNIAINLTMQQRGLPVAYVITVGNQAQATHAELANAIIEDERVTALGLHVEGFSDVRAFEKLSAHADSGARAWRVHRNPEST